jgi:hypothetical protein
MSLNHIVKPQYGNNPDPLNVEFNNCNIDGVLNTHSLAVSGNLSVSGNETVTGNVIVGGNETIAGTLGVTGNETIGGTLGVTGAITSSNLILSAVQTPNISAYQVPAATYVNFDATNVVGGLCLYNGHSQNVSAVNYNSLGNYTLHFNTALPSANYLVLYTSSPNNAVAPTFASFENPTNGSVTLLNFYLNTTGSPAFGGYDAKYNSVMIIPTV